MNVSYGGVFAVGNGHVMALDTASYRAYSIYPPIGDRSCLTADLP